MLMKRGSKEREKERGSSGIELEEGGRGNLDQGVLGHK